MARLLFKGEWYGRIGYFADWMTDYLCMRAIDICTLHVYGKCMYWKSSKTCLAVNDSRCPSLKQRDAPMPGLGKTCPGSRIRSSTAGVGTAPGSLHSFPNSTQIWSEHRSGETLNESCRSLGHDAAQRCEARCEFFTNKIWGVRNAQICLWQSKMPLFYVIFLCFSQCSLIQVVTKVLLVQRWCLQDLLWNPPDGNAWLWLLKSQDLCAASSPSLVSAGCLAP